MAVLLDAPLDGSFFVTTVTNPPYEHDDSHMEDAVAQLIEILRKPVTTAILTEAVRPLQDTEDAIWELGARMFNIAGSGGAMLDLVGKFLVLPRRDGWNDATYRNRLNAQILIYNSEGRVEDLIGIVLLLLSVSGTGQVEFREHLGPACMTAYIAKVLDAVEVEDLRVSLARAKAGGVRLHFVFAQEADSIVAGDATGAVVGGTAGDASVGAGSQPAGVGPLTSVAVAAT